MAAFPITGSSQSSTPTNTVALVPTSLTDCMKRISELTAKVNFAIPSDNPLLKHAFCSIIQGTASDPVITNCGHVFEKTALAKWGNDKPCSMCNTKITTTTSGLPLKNLVEECQNEDRIPTFDHFEKEDSFLAEAHLRIAGANRKRKDYPAAIKAYGEAFKYTKSIEHYTEMLKLLEMMNEKEQAVLGYLHLARYQMEVGQFSDAVKTLEYCKTIVPKPSEMEIFEKIPSVIDRVIIEIKLAQIEIKLAQNPSPKNFTRIIAAFKEMLMLLKTMELDEFGHLSYTLGSAKKHMKNGEFSDAVKSLECCKRIVPKQSETEIFETILSVIAKVIIEIKLTQIEVLAQIEIELAQNPSPENIIKVIASVNALSKDFSDEAIRFYRLILERDPLQFEVYEPLSQLLNKDIAVKVKLLLDAAELAKQQGKSAWEEKFRKLLFPGCITEEQWADQAQLLKIFPPYPQPLIDFLEGPDPLGSGKQAKETHIVFPSYRSLRFGTFREDGRRNLRIMSLNTLSEIDRSSGGPGCESSEVNNHVKKTSTFIPWDRRTYYGNSSEFDTSHYIDMEFEWLVMTSAPLPNSGTMDLASQQKLLSSNGYDMPSAIDVVTGILWEHRRTEMKYLNRIQNPISDYYIRLIEPSGEYLGYRLAIFTNGENLSITHSCRDSDVGIGVVGIRNFKEHPSLNTRAETATSGSELVGSASSNARDSLDAG